MDEEIKLKRQAQRLELWKFIIGTVILGAVTLLVNDSIQRKKIDLELNRNESEHLGKFVTQYLALPKLEDKQEFLLFMITISYTEETQGRYKALLDTVNKKIQLRDKLLTEIQSLEKRVNEPVIANATRLEREVVKKQELGATTDEINAKKSELEKVVKENPDLIRLQDLNQQVARIENSYTSIKKVLGDSVRNVNKPGYVLVEDHSNEWIKEDYWRKYGEYYLALNKLDNKSDQVTFQLRTSEKVNEGVVSTFQLSAGELRVIDDKRFKVEVKLLRIGAAGRFPLPKAAIYSIRIFEVSAK